MEKLYQTNKDFRDYVDRYMSNKNVTLEEVLSYKQTQYVAAQYREKEETRVEQSIADSVQYRDGSGDTGRTKDGDKTAG